jgi:hypothetical protein
MEESKQALEEMESSVYCCCKEFLERFLSCMEKSSVVPLEILVRKEESAKLFEAYAARLNIKVSEVKKLQNIDNARRSMMHLKGLKK